MGGASATRSSGPRPSPSPATPELIPFPWDPVRVPATGAAATLFLPPALSLIHPALYLYLPASIFVLLTPASNPASLLAAPPSLSPPTATATPTTSAASKPRGTSRRRTSGRGPPSPHRRRPRRPGRGGEGAQNIAPCRSRDRAAARWYLRTVIPRCHHRRQGLGGGERPRRRLPGAEVATEEAAAAVIIITCFVVGCGRMLCDWFVGGGVLIQKVLWYVGGTGGHGKNDGITISITNAGAKKPT